MIVAIVFPVMQVKCYHKITQAPSLTWTTSMSHGRKNFLIHYKFFELMSFRLLQSSGILDQTIALTELKYVLKVIKIMNLLNLIVLLLIWLSMEVNLYVKYS